MGYVRKKWTYKLESDGQEAWTHGIYKTKKEAIKEGIKEAKYLKNKYIYIEEAVQDAIPAIDVDEVIENIQDDMCEAYGEFAEGYLNCVKSEQALDLEKKLNAVLQEWLKDNKYEPNFYHILYVETIRVEELDNE